MAEEVAEWRLLYNIDGIDLDIETGAGDHVEAGENMVYFIQKLRELDPDIIIGQPTFGYPQVEAEINVINESWNADGSSNNLADSVGLMVYDGTSSLDYVEDYAHGTEQWEGFPIVVNVPYNAIMLGAKVMKIYIHTSKNTEKGLTSFLLLLQGIISDADADTLASEVVRQDLLGIMVWFASVINGFVYDAGWDTSQDPASQEAYCRALETVTA